MYFFFYNTNTLIKHSSLLSTVFCAILFYVYNAHQRANQKPDQTTIFTLMKIFNTKEMKNISAIELISTHTHKIIVTTNTTSN